MNAWWESLTTLERVFACMAIPSSVLLVVQTILLLTGLIGQHDGDLSMHHDHSGLSDVHDVSGGDESDGVFGVDLDHDGVPGAYEDSVAHDPGLRILTVRGLIAFFSVGGWTGLALLRGQTHAVLSSLSAMLAGLLAMLVLAWLMKLTLRLQSEGNIDMHNAVGISGSVYITIPPQRGEKGKVTLMVQNRLTEADAVTDEAEPIKTGTPVRVVGTTQGNVLVVESGSTVDSSV